MRHVEAVTARRGTDLFLDILADLVVHFQFFFELLELLALNLILLARRLRRGEKVEERVGRLRLPYQTCPVGV